MIGSSGESFFLFEGQMFGMLKPLLLGGGYLYDP